MTTTTLYQDLSKFPDCNSDISTEGTKKFAILPHKGSSSDNLNNTTIQKTRPKVHFAKIRPRVFYITTFLYFVSFIYLTVYLNRYLCPIE
jgi:hypothetical protein